MSPNESSTNRNPGRPELKRARRIAGLSGSQLARRIGVTAAAVSGWERGLRSPAPQFIPPLADALKLSPGELVDIIDNGAHRPAA